MVTWRVKYICIPIRVTFSTHVLMNILHIRKNALTIMFRMCSTYFQEIY